MLPDGIAPARHPIQHTPHIAIADPLPDNPRRIANCDMVAWVSRNGFRRGVNSA